MKLLKIKLSLLFTILISSFLWLLPINEAQALTFNQNSTFLGAIFHFEGKVPTNLGIKEDKLTPCPATPNCVVSQESDKIHQIEPIAYETDQKTAKETLLKVLSVVPNTVIVKQTDNYIQTESRSKIMGFVDDGEFYFPTDKKVILIRSASRLGESDLGVNRTRLEQIRLAMKDLATR